MESLNVGEIMPTFETKAIDGTLITSSSLAGKYTAIVFLSPECTSCVLDFPRIVALGREIAASELKLILVSIGELKATQHLLGNQILDFPVVNTSFEDLFISKLKAYSTPSYYLFSKSGKLEKVGSEVKYLEIEIKQLGVLQEAKQ
jgi:peroxiredoxin